jgi:hypothetical protein
VDSTKEKITRFKEGVLLLLFMIFLFSFTGKSLAKKDTTSKKHPLELVSFAKLKSTTTTKVPFFKYSKAPLTLKGFLLPGQNRARENQRTSLIISFFLNNYFLIKPRLFRGFNYFISFAREGEFSI